MAADMGAVKLAGGVGKYLKRGLKEANAGSGGFKDFVKKAAKGAWKNTVSEEGIDRLVGNVVAGAAWGTGIGGVSEWAQGGSFWEGAKSGAFKGALYYGVGGTALGSAARAFDPNTGGIKGSASTLSKQLKAVMRNNKEAAKAAKVTRS
jgi:hypothetical protein